MSNLRFEIKVKWSGVKKNGEGQVEMGGETVRFSEPADMGGKGIGASPEDLLISAVSSCYSGTLFGLLVKNSLPVHHIQVRAEGFVTGYPLQTKFSRIVVHPEIFGCDKSRQSDYEKAVVSARDRCFIGKAIAGNIDYSVGRVQVESSLVPKEQVDELVDRFYSRLIQVPYYSNMFAERKVDIDQLKARQRVFINRLINGTIIKEDSDEVKQVRERHQFRTTPERAEIWMNTMRDTMNDTDLDRDIKESLLEKMQFLMNQLIENNHRQ